MFHDTLASITSVLSLRIQNFPAFPCPENPEQSRSFMPELPEVETTRAGIEPHLTGETIRAVIIRETRLRLPINPGVSSLEGAKVFSVKRRAKYLLLNLGPDGTLLIHLGMSGGLRIVTPDVDWKKHDHVALELASGTQLRFHDPRRFGIFLHLPANENPEAHPLLASLGPEPFDPTFNTIHLRRLLAKRTSPIKVALMDNKVVVGVGNIYASEALFRAGILPTCPANKVSAARLGKLIEAVRTVLSEAIKQGGTTLRDFLREDGSPGYFRQQLFVYDRSGEPCRVCSTPIRHMVLGQRSTYWCPRCQR